MNALATRPSVIVSRSSAPPAPLPPRPNISPDAFGRKQRQRHHARLNQLPSLAGSIGSTGGEDNGKTPSSVGPSATSDSSSSPQAAAAGAEKQPGLWTRVKEWVTGSKDREKLASMGMAAFFSYSFISNVTYGACLTIAWVAFVKQKGISPLASGQWAPFLAFYAGLWAVQNIVRPLRFALSIALAPVFDRFLNMLAARVGGDKKIAFTIGLLLMSLLMVSCMFSSIYLLGGLPDGLGPFPPLKRL